MIDETRRIYIVSAEKTNEFKLYALLILFMKMRERPKALRGERYIAACHCFEMIDGTMTLALALGDVVPRATGMRDACSTTNEGERG